jgi:hypothetical protein
MSEPLGEQLSTDLIEHYLRTRGRRYFRGQHDGEFFFVANAAPQRLHVHIGISRWRGDVLTIRANPTCFFPDADALRLEAVIAAWNQRHRDFAAVLHGSSDPRRIGVVARGTLRVRGLVDFDEFASFVDNAVNAAIDLFGELTPTLAAPVEPLLLDAS